LFTTKKIALVSVINDLVTDNRVKKTCLTLQECGYDVVLIGRKLPSSLPLNNFSFKTQRMKLVFLKGPLFYLFFNLRLFLKLLFSRAHLLYANDLDTLIPNYLVSKIKSIPLIYDSHELFCEVPELIQSPLKKRIWLFFESKIVPRLSHCITVNDSIANIFEKKYKTKFNVVRNISDAENNFQPKTKMELNLPLDKKIILLQGAGINIDRGAEELLDAMSFINGALLLIIGSGDVWTTLENKVKTNDLKCMVMLIHKIPKNELMHYTYNADLGLSIDKNTNLNYYYSLPNKIFDYLQAGVPILASRLPEIEKIITKYEVGDFIDSHEPNAIASKINELLFSDKLVNYKSNVAIVNSQINWHHEKKKLAAVIKEATDLV
jgi:glycosyltransferase involved in cell wall biosynthesis